MEYSNNPYVHTGDWGSNDPRVARRTMPGKDGVAEGASGVAHQFLEKSKEDKKKEGEVHGSYDEGVNGLRQASHEQTAHNSAQLGGDMAAMRAKARYEHALGRPIDDASWEKLRAYSGGGQHPQGGGSARLGGPSSNPQEYSGFEGEPVFQTHPSNIPGQPATTVVGGPNLHPAGGAYISPQDQATFDQASAQGQKMAPKIAGSGVPQSSLLGPQQQAQGPAPAPGGTLPPWANQTFAGAQAQGNKMAPKISGSPNPGAKPSPLGSDPFAPGYTNVQDPGIDPNVNYASDEPQQPSFGATLAQQYKPKVREEF